MAAQDHAILLDIEGTIGDIAFVRQVLFPYARARMAQTLFAHWHDPEIAHAVEEARQLSGKGLEVALEAANLFLEWMDQDRKITPLKAVQGVIWRAGYAQGELEAHLYPDAVEAFAQWRSQGMRLYVYSSGSVEAQKLYLAHSLAGDQSAMFDGFFDTTTGPKTEPASYAAIARHLDVAPGRIVFFSDMKPEIAAAQHAGLRAVRIDRTLDPTVRGEDETGLYLGSFKTFLMAG
jgi:enolase-phosphatase E1